MASSTANFRNRDEHRKQMELEEARKAGLAPAEVDEETGKEINPHIPQYMSTAPWYLNESRPTLKHQRNWKQGGGGAAATQAEWYDRGAKTFHAAKYRKGACDNCGAITHKVKDCVERPRKVGAKWTNTNIAPDEKVQDFDLDYEGKRDRWNGYDASTYSRVIDLHEKVDELKRHTTKQRELQKKFTQKEGATEDKEINEEEEGDDNSDEDDVDDDAKLDESEQMDFGKVEKRVRTAGGGSTGTVRNLRIREDTAKYLRNLDTNSAYYDPKTRSMRENPTPNADADAAVYKGDNFIRGSGSTKDFLQLNLHAWESFERGQDVHVQAVPSQAELLYQEFRGKKEKLTTKTKHAILEQYGNAAAQDLDNDGTDMLPAQTEQYVEYDRAGRVIKGQEAAKPTSKYEEDVHVHNHTAVWGSWWKDHMWGYACCHQTMKNSYCLGHA
eukprot:jgi/Chlat1/1558/Chrsp123S01838